MRKMEAEVERLIRVRAHEWLNFELERRGLAPAEPLPASDHVSLLDEERS